MAGGSAVDSVAFSSGGHTLASGSDDGTIRLRDVTDPAHPRRIGPTLPGSSVGAVHAEVRRDGRSMVAGGDDDGTIRLWHVTDPAHPSRFGQPLTGSSVAVDSVAFGPDGRTLASGSDDGITRLWNLNVGDAINRICATAGGLTARQWNEYIP